MGLQNRIMEWLLTRIDRALDLVTLGWWQRSQGEVTWSEIKIKRSMR